MLLYKDNKRILLVKVPFKLLALATLSLLDIFGKYLLIIYSRYILLDKRAPSEPECLIYTKTRLLHLPTIIAPLLLNPGAILSYLKEVAIPTNKITATLNICISNILKDARKELEHEMLEKESYYWHLFSSKPF